MSKRSNPALWLLSLGNGGVDQPFNDALGGSITEVADYNGTGETWRIHTFTSGGTFEVLSDPNPFRVLVVDGGKTGGIVSVNGPSGKGGDGGAVVDHASANLSTGTHAVTVGGSDQSSSVGSVTASGGSYGVGGAGGVHGQGIQPGASGGDGPTSNVSGSLTYYSGGGGGGGADSGGPSAGGNRGGGGGAGGSPYSGGKIFTPGDPNTGGGGGGQGFESGVGAVGPGAGGSGIVIVAYRIA